MHILFVLFIMWLSQVVPKASVTDWNNSKNIIVMVYIYISFELMSLYLMILVIATVVNDDVVDPILDLVYQIL